MYQGIAHAGKIAGGYLVEECQSVSGGFTI